MVGQTGNKEIDFIAEKNNEKIYIQVALRITDDQTKKKEFGNLLEINDNYPKYVITLDDYSVTSYKGINHLLLLFNYKNLIIRKFHPSNIITIEKKFSFTVPK